MLWCGGPVYESSKVISNMPSTAVTTANLGLMQKWVFWLEKMRRIRIVEALCRVSLLSF